MRNPLLTLFFILASGFAALSAQPAAPFCIGETIRLHSDSLGEDRSVNIYLPPDYRDDDTTHYHVIYLLDGSVDEDFVHVAGLVQFYTFPWVAQLPATIIVGIANVDRKRDYSFPTRNKKQLAGWPTTGHSAPFMAFIASELIPHIEASYRCSGQRTIIGQSFGGLLATEILLRRPALFNRYLIISPSIWWDDASLLRASYGPFTQPTAVHICVGKEGLVPGSKTETMEADARSLADKLRKLKSPALRVSFDYLPDEDHASIGHLGIMHGFRALFPKPAAH